MYYCHTLKNIAPSGKLECDYFSIFQSSKVCILQEKLLSISLKLNFTPHTLGCYYGLKTNLPLHILTLKEVFLFELIWDSIHFVGP